MVDSARNVYVSGYTGDQLPGATSLGSNDGFLMKYDKDGVQQWLIQIGSTGDDKAYGLTIDANDYLYVASLTDGTIGATNFGSYDIAVMQVNSAGSIEWTEQFGTSGAESYPKPVANSDGDLFISGRTDGAFSGYTNQGDRDWFLYKVEAKSTTTSSSSTTSSTTSSSTTSSSTTSSTTSTSSSSTGSVTSTSTSSRSLVALVAN